MTTAEAPLTVVGHLFNAQPPDVTFDMLPALSARGISGEVAAVMDNDPRWAAVNRRVSLRAMVAAATTVSASGLLRDAGIPHLVYKGLTSSLLTHSAWERRMSADVDLLVAPDDIPAAESALAAAGLIRNPKNRRFDRLTAWANCEVGWGGSGLPIDLHWRIDSNPGLFRDPVSTVIARATTVRLQGQEIPTFGSVDAALACAVHGTRELWVKWRAILDLMRLTAMNDQAELLGRARAMGCHRSLTIGFAVCHLAGMEQAPLLDKSTTNVAKRMLTRSGQAGVSRTRQGLSNRTLKFRSSDSFSDAGSGLARAVVRQFIGP